MRRLLSFILFLCVTIGVMAQSDYGLTVTGTPVTSANKGDILGDGKVSYDPASHTLRLKNAKIETGVSAIFTEDRLIIDLEGDNSILSPRCVESCYNPASATDFGLTICSTSGSGTLRTEGYESGFNVANSGGIYIHDCSITARHSMSAIKGYISGNNTTLKIEHANIDIEGQSTEACISGFENLVLEKCEIVEPADAYYKCAWGYGAMRQGNDDTKCLNLKIKAEQATHDGIIVTYDGADTCYKLEDVPTVKYDNEGGVKYALLYLNGNSSPVLRVALDGRQLLITYGEYTTTGIEGTDTGKVTITESAGKKIIRGGKLIIIGKDGKKYNAAGVEIE